MELGLQGGGFLLWCEGCSDTVSGFEGSSFAFHEDDVGWEIGGKGHRHATIFTCAAHALGHLDSL